MPAKAGIQKCSFEAEALDWIPAFAGMTPGGAVSGRRCIRLRNVSQYLRMRKIGGPTLSVKVI